MHRRIDHDQQPAGAPARSPAARRHLDSVSASMLALQATAGNAAVGRAIGQGRGPAPNPAPRTAGPVVAQRDKKSTIKPAAEAKKVLDQLYPHDKVMAGVKFADMSKANEAVQSGNYGAWTRSNTEIFIQHPAKLVEKGDEVPGDAVLRMFLAYTVRHESQHVQQFVRKTGGQPQTWQRMLEYEHEAYGDDIKWLASSVGRKFVPDAGVRDGLAEGAEDKRDAIKAKLDETAPMKPEVREPDLRRWMIDEKLIPGASGATPKSLYDAKK